MDSPRVLIVDDDQSVCSLLSKICSNCNYQVDTASSAKTFISSYDDFNPELIILDLHLGDADGIELLRYLADANYSSKIIIISGYEDKVLAIAQKIGKEKGLNVVGYLQKPVKKEQLVSILERIRWDNSPISVEDIATAIQAQEITVYYQPKINLLNNQIVGVEGLARWQHNGTLILPDRFIPVAETSLLMKSLTMAIIEIAFKNFHDFQCTALPISLSINLSGKDLNDASFPDTIRTLAKYHSIDPSHICFELTETTVMAPGKLILEILTRLRLIGFGLSIDDFGTGYSSLAELRKMPFNEIKIDKSFVFDILDDKDAQVITRAIIDLGHNMGLITTAEGVESKEVLEQLKTYHCDIAQGYYFSRPLPLSELIEWISNFVQS